MSRCLEMPVYGCARRCRPVLTVVAVAVAVVAAVLQYAVPAMVPALQRESSGLAHGQYWRLATPLLVQTLGWYQVLANLVTLAVIGAVAEWVLGRRWWLVLFAAGTVGGQLAAYSWHEWGGGDSIAICGLAGGVLVAQLVSRDPPLGWASEAVLCYIVALAGWGMFGVVAAGLVVLAAALGLYLLRRVGRAGGYRLALAATGVGALGLATRRDLHRAALTFAMVFTAGLLTHQIWARKSALPISGPADHDSSTEP
jgi:hypothetical protein